MLSGVSWVLQSHATWRLLKIETIMVMIYGLRTANQNSRMQQNNAPLSSFHKVDTRRLTSKGFPRLIVEGMSTTLGRSTVHVIAATVLFNRRMTIGTRFGVLVDPG